MQMTRDKIIKDIERMEELVKLYKEKLRRLDSAPDISPFLSKKQPEDNA